MAQLAWKKVRGECIYVFFFRIFWEGAGDNEEGWDGLELKLHVISPSCARLNMIKQWW